MLATPSQGRFPSPACPGRGGWPDEAVRVHVSLVRQRPERKENPANQVPNPGIAGVVGGEQKRQLSSGPIQEPWEVFPTPSPTLGLPPFQRDL